MSLEKTDDVLYHNNGGKEQKRRKTDTVDDSLYLYGESFTGDHFDKDNEDPSTVECGNGKKVHKSKIHTDNNGDIEKRYKAVSCRLSDSGGNADGS